MTNSNPLLAIISKFCLICLILFTSGCDTFDDDCGPHTPTGAKVGKVNFNTMKYAYLNGQFQFDTVASPGDTVNFQALGLGIYPQLVYYPLAHISKPTFSLFPAAYACSPPVPSGSRERIKSITVTADRDYNSFNLAGTDLIGLFNIIVTSYYPNSTVTEQTLISYLEDGPTVPQEMLLVLHTPPDQTGEFIFTVVFEFYGIDIQRVDYKSKIVVVGRL